MRKKLSINFVPENSRLTFIKQTIQGVPSYKTPNKKAISPKALYKCACGNLKEIFINSAKSGQVLSCGCYNLERLQERAKHGFYCHPLYRLWASVKARCTNENEKCYKNYGGRGVKMCDEWINDPEAFIKWCLNNGWKKGLDLDKDLKAKEMNLPPPLVYSPEWCQFITRKKNNNATRHNVEITFNGMTKNIVQWATYLGVVPNTLQNRIRRRGWSIEKAFTTSVKVYKNKNK